MGKVACCQNCHFCCSKNEELQLGLCWINDGFTETVKLKDLCEGFTWNYNNDKEYIIGGLE